MKFERTGEKSIMKQMRYIALVLSMAVLLMTLTACGGGGEETPTTTVNADGTLSGEATDTLNVYLSLIHI